MKKEQDKPRSVIGIDLGTANTAAFYRGEDGNELIQIRPNELDTIQGMVFPSYVEFDAEGNPLNIGRQAWDNSAFSRNTVIWGSKRLIGLTYQEAENERRHLDYPIEKAPDGRVHIVVGEKRYSPTDIAAMILGKVKADAENPKINMLPRKITKVIVSHPANFNPIRVEATKEAAQKVFPGTEIDTVPEPVAAALAYGIQVPQKKSILVCVIDWGAGTLDVVTAVLARSEKDNQLRMSPDAARGKANLGGIDMDDLIVDWAIKEYGLTEFEKARLSKVSTQQMGKSDIAVHLSHLRRQIELAKIRLSRPKSKPQEFSITHLGDQVDITLTREKLEQILEVPLTRERIEEILQSPLTSERLQWISSTLSKIRSGKEEIKGKSPSKQPDVRADAPMQAPQNISKPQADLNEVGMKKADREAETLPSFLDIFRVVVMNSISLGNYTPEQIDRLLLVGGPMNMPIVRNAVKEIFINNKIVSDDMERIEQHGFIVNPMECVARGAALYDIAVIDVSLGDYAVPLGEWEEHGKHYIVYSRLVHEGNALPAEGFKQNERTRWDDKLASVRISLLESRNDEVSPNGVKLWKRKGDYNFHPAWDSRGKAFYTIKLKVEKDKISCICYDKTLDKNYNFSTLNIHDGELLAEDKYELFEDEWPDPSLTRKQIEQVSNWAPYVLGLANNWLSERHDSEEEQNRPEVVQKGGLLQHFLADAPRPEDIEWVANGKGEQAPRDRKVDGAWKRVLFTARDLNAFFAPAITDNDLENLRGQASFLRQTMSRDILGNSKIAGGLQEEVQRKSEELEQSLRRLPKSFPPPGYSKKRQDIQNFAEASTRAEVLRAAIESARGAKLGR